jgi:ribokinase
MKKIAVVGSSNIDMIIKSSRLPRPGETVGDGIFAKVNGGKGANQAVAAARAGGNVVFISCLGYDEFAAGMLSSFKMDGIETQNISLEENVSTGIALILVDKKGENCISVSPGANANLRPDHIKKAEKAIIDSDLVLLQLEIPMESVLYTIELAKKNNKKIMLNPAPAKMVDNYHLAMIHCLVLNETETEFLTGFPVETDSQIRDAAAELLKKGPQYVVITLGARGAFVKTSEREEFIPGFVVKAVDTTAAGDVYCGNLAVALVNGESIFEAAKFASAASAISVTRFGAQPSAPEFSVTNEFLKNRNNII